MSNININVNELNERLVLLAKAMIADVDFFEDEVNKLHREHKDDPKSFCYAFKLMKQANDLAIKMTLEDSSNENQLNEQFNKIIKVLIKNPMHVHKMAFDLRIEYINDNKSFEVAVEILKQALDHALTIRKEVADHGKL